MFPLFLILLSRCNVEGGLHQLHSCAGEPHTTLVVYSNHMHACQFISSLTPKKLENPNCRLSKISFIFSNSITIWGNNVPNVALSAFQTVL